MLKPIKIQRGKVILKLNFSISLKSLAEFIPNSYVHKKDIYWKNREGRYNKKSKGSPKSRSSCKIIDLRREFHSLIYPYETFNPEINDILTFPDSGRSAQDYEYNWHFVHRHGFPSDLYGSGRGQSAKARDIVNHPLTYLLMISEHHEQYDRDNGEWKNPNNHNSSQIPQNVEINS